jgi:hypothetical protein
MNKGANTTCGSVLPALSVMSCLRSDGLPVSQDCWHAQGFPDDLRVFLGVFLGAMIARLRGRTIPALGVAVLGVAVLGAGGPWSGRRPDAAGADSGRFDSLRTA